MNIAGSQRASWGKTKGAALEKDQADEERGRTPVNDPRRDLGHVFDHKDGDGYRRDDHAHHHDDADQDAEPDGVEAELDDGGEEDGGGQDDEGKVLDKGAAELVNEADQEQDDVAVDVEIGQVVGDAWGMLVTAMKWPRIRDPAMSMRNIPPVRIDFRERERIF